MNSLTTYDGARGRYVRWRLNERIQHGVLALSFVVLVITGFALKYPGSWWVRPWAGTEWIFDLRGLLHRIAGVVFLVLGFYHVIFMFATNRGRDLLAAFRPRLKDVRDFGANLACFIGLRKNAPAFGHFSYMEKMEYFALIWGAVIMGGTGLMLWFEWITLTVFPRWVIDLLTVIHLYEAWLATLAIAVWHFYYVIFNPDVYPLNRGMIDGRISEEELRTEHRGEWLESPELSGEETRAA